MLKGYYTDIEFFPLQNWINCNNGDLTATRQPIQTARERHFFRKSNNWNRDNDVKAWENLYNDFLQKVGPSEEFTDLIEMLIERARLQIDYLKDQDADHRRKRKKLNPINELTAKIRSFHMTGKSEKTVSISKILNAISKKQGYQIRIKDLTVLAYFELLKDYNNG